jgi:hypothetical protein
MTSTADAVDDLALALIAQNNMLLALVRSHPNRDVLATAFDQAQRQFSEPVTWSAQDPAKFPYTKNTIAAFETALRKPLDP